MENNTLLECDHKGVRFSADDPERRKNKAHRRIGFEITYECLHGRRYVIVAPCIEGLNTSQFETPCDCRELKQIA